MKKLLATLLIFLVPSLCFGAVTFDTATGASCGQGNTTCASASITVATGHSNLALVVFIGAGNQTHGVVSSVASSVGNAGITWSHCVTGGSSNGSGTYHGDCFVGTGISTGAQVITATFAGTTDQASGVVVASVYNVNQSTPSTGYVTNTSGNTVVNVTSGDMAFSAEFDNTNQNSVSGCTTTRDFSAFASYGTELAHCTNSPTSTFTWSTIGTQAIAMGVDIQQTSGTVSVPSGAKVNMNYVVWNINNGIINF